jgi:hypothetical protein
MDSDETSSITDPDEAKWIASHRELVMRYLTSQRVEHNGVSLEPRWFLSPYVAVWAIRSRNNPERVGWWAISGDVPTDYMTCGSEQNSADILLAFAARWRDAAKHMARGEQPDGFTIGDLSKARELAPLLATRAELLHDLAMEEKSGDHADEVI